ncbi:pyruvate dehydrogenase (acetyl-transferring) E1 component subunit alpha [Agitococcus lubricus]|uniref:Pyruvate dehydrogenase E1 component subunit alpha n=1 Tax=Agitococcus lubricus TaxID=1077255 RepID=A0A2T5IV11_9GAMM|nr:pyruvate dehydrogenase (acetyl-transferring) E1 component subunit alpha [Agitococcus lubricus]PTQ87708.1 pyruvate dehydrogenase E1 component alpha subunit [Agitococcus lubricus]
MNIASLAAPNYPIYQVLLPNGRLGQPLSDTLNDTQCHLAAYEHLWRTRLFDQRAVALQRTGQLGTYASCLGQEAISTAIGFSLQANDVFVPYYRDQAAQLCRGMKMASILQFWGGDEWGSYHTNNQDLPACIPIATQITHAAGVATALKLQQKKQAVVSTCGDGASSRGDFYEALNLAGVWHLPLVVVINNNQWAISVPLSQQTACATLAQKAVAAGIVACRVDGNDFFALMMALEEALERARSGKGATLIEAVTYRLCDHTTADDMSRYASLEQRQHAEEQEPLKRFRLFLEHTRHWQDAQQQALETRLKHEIEEAVTAYLQLASPAISDMFTHVYSHLPTDLAQQQQAFLRLKGLSH